MSKSSSVYAAILAFSVAFAGFSVISVQTPAGYPLDAVWDHGLIRDIVFDGSDFKALENIQARLVYRNPSDLPVSFNLTYPVLCTFYADRKKDSGSGSGAEGAWEIVTVPAGGEYTVFLTGFRPDGAGWYEVEWGGVRRGVAVAKSEALPRIVTDKAYYMAGDGGGKAVFEYYNPTGHNVTIPMPGCMRFDRFYLDGKVEGVSGVCIDYIWANYTLPPGGSFKVWEFYFSTMKAGSSVIEGAGAKTTVLVLPVGS
jgi:hypothetical protein